MVTIEIEKCTALQRVYVAQTDEANKCDGDCLQVKACPQLTRLYMMGDAGEQAEYLVEVHIDQCLALTDLYVMGEAASADIYRLSCLTCLTVSELDGRDDWPVQTFLDHLQCLKVLDNLSIIRHSFTETELTVASTGLRAFKIIHPKTFELRRLHMQCPKLEELKITDDEEYEGYGPYGYDEDISDKKWMEDVRRGAQLFIDFSACANLRHINLDDEEFVHFLSPKLVLDLVSNGRNQELLRTRRIIHLLNLIQTYGDRLACKEMLNL